MADSFSVMALSMEADLHKINASSQNISNVNTPAYKRQVSFTEWMSHSSVPQTSTILDKSHGVMSLTNGLYDVAIAGDGYFQLNTGTQKLLSRNGAFKLDQEGFLVLGDGQRVQGEHGDIFVGDKLLTVTKQGDVLLDGEYSTRFSLVRLKPSAKLIPSDQNTFAYSEHDARKGNHDVFVHTLHQGYLEKSNVDARIEMLNLVETMRHFELQQKVLRSYNSVIDVGITDLGSF